jgi:hypothetical protein
MPLFLDVPSLDDPLPANDVTHVHDAGLCSQRPRGVTEGGH